MRVFYFCPKTAYIFSDCLADIFEFFYIFQSYVYLKFFKTLFELQIFLCLDAVVSEAVYTAFYLTYYIVDSFKVGSGRIKFSLGFCFLLLYITTPAASSKISLLLSGFAADYLRYLTLSYYRIAVYTYAGIHYQFRTSLNRH